eukprot:TRINITY_DN12300_c0_g1_i1.p1 TRINITY_DN12300_c0_g1~~TRINITY_DN12300_c0_g1_i1.p1  ORF type:complete len:126 (-),score=37.19 TRINITY_DN12300_c0_g1_i1:86-463(-)
MVFLTVTRYPEKDFTLVEHPVEGQRNDKRSLCEIFNDLESQGYTLVSSGGSKEQVVLIFHQEGIIESEPEPVDSEGSSKRSKKSKSKKSSTPQSSDTSEEESQESESSEEKPKKKAKKKKKSARD